MQPIYAFGKINNLRAAATHGMAVEEARVHQKATEVAMLVREAYYGYLLAASLEKLALEIGSQLGSTLKKVRRQLDAGVPGVDNVDLLKLQTFQGQLEKQLNDILQGKALALAGLRTLTGLTPSLPIELADARLQPLERQAPLLEEAISDAHRLRPEFVQAREGVKAFERLLAAAEADYYPLVFVGLFGNLAEATNRSRLSNPFVYDPLMDDVLSPVVGMRWHFDLGVTAAKVDEGGGRTRPGSTAERPRGTGHPLPGPAGVPGAGTAPGPTYRPRARRSAAAVNGWWRRWPISTSGWARARTWPRPPWPTRSCTPPTSRRCTTSTSVWPGSTTGPAATWTRCAGTCRRCRRCGDNPMRIGVRRCWPD